MKITQKAVPLLVSIIIISSLFITTATAAPLKRNYFDDIWDGIKVRIGQPFKELWAAVFDLQHDVADLQNQVNELEVTAGAARYVIEGTFDITQDGDLIKADEMSTTSSDTAIRYLHWKRIDVPQLTLSNIPSIQVFVKSPTIGSDEPESLTEAWREATVLYDEGCIYLEYKLVRSYSPEISYWVTGEYKVVVIK